MIFLCSATPPYEIRLRLHELTLGLGKGLKIGKCDLLATELLKDPWISSFCPNNNLIKSLLR